MGPFLQQVQAFGSTLSEDWFAASCARQSSRRGTRSLADPLCWTDRAAQKCGVTSVCRLQVLRPNLCWGHEPTKRLTCSERGPFTSHGKLRAFVAYVGI